MMDAQDSVEVDDAVATRLKLLWSIARPTDSVLVDVPRLQAVCDNSSVVIVVLIPLFTTILDAHRSNFVVATPTCSVLSRLDFGQST